MRPSAEPRWRLLGVAALAAAIAGGGAAIVAIPPLQDTSAAVFTTAPVIAAPPTTTTTTPARAEPVVPVPSLTTPVSVAQPRATPIAIHAAPGGPVTQSLTNHDGLTLTFLVRRAATPEWLEVFLPTRPNGSTGYVNVADVSVTSVDHQVRIDVPARRLTAWAGDWLIVDESVAVGKPTTPTPNGTFYVQQAVPMDNPRGAYGPFIIAISAHSEVYETFAGGDGLVGIHGTNAPSSVGNPVSNGCIRMSNEAVTRLANAVPPGTPVVIVGR